MNNYADCTIFMGNPTLFCDEINNNLIFHDLKLSGRSRSKFAVCSSDSEDEGWDPLSIKTEVEE